MQQRFGRSFDELSRIVAMTDAFFERQGVDPSLRNTVDLAIEELFVNMVTYNGETSEDILVELHARPNGIEVSLTDFDVERFDPREVRPINLDAPLEARPPGGLGLYLVLKMVDSIHYQYGQRQSKITFCVNTL